MSNITVTRHADRLHVRAPYAHKDTIKMLAGRRWDKDLKTWHVPATIAATDGIRAHLGHLPLDLDLPTLELFAAAESARAALGMKHATDLDDFPGRTEGWLHQRQAYHFMHPRDGGGLFMDMGTGKSKVAIGLMEGWGIDVAVILAPPKAVRVWPREFHGGDVPGFDGHSDRDWVVVNGRGVRGSSGKVLAKASMKQRLAQAQDALAEAAAQGRPCAIVVNYEAAWQEPIRGYLVGIKQAAREVYGRDVRAALINDESHKIKSPKGKWSNTAAAIGAKVDKVLDLTGTPNPHSEPDLYAQFRAFDPGVFGTNFSHFQRRFFDMGGFEGREVKGFLDAEAEAEFVRLFAENAYICDSDDVLDLPETNDLPTLTCRLGVEASRHYANLYDSFVTALDDDGGYDSDGEPVVSDNALTQLLRLAQITSGHLPVGDADLGTKRIVTVDTSKAELLADTLDDLPIDEPLVVFGRFHHDLAVIQEKVEASGRTYAEVSGRKGVRDGLSEDGKMIEDADVVGVQLQAGGVGVDLTRARYAIYYSLDFNLGDFKQSRKRVHRPGQTRPVFFIFLACEGTVDEVIAQALQNRDAVLTALKNQAKTHHDTAAVAA